MPETGSPASCLNASVSTVPQVHKTCCVDSITSSTNDPPQCPPAMPASIVTVQAEASLDPYRFNMFMSDLLAEHGKHITHMAGTLSIQVNNEMVREFKFEGAHQTVRFGPCGSSANSSLRPHSRLVFTGLNICEQELQEAFSTCLWQALPAGWTEYFAGQRPFYVHHATAAKQWHRPTSSPQPTQALPPTQVLPSAQSHSRFASEHSHAQAQSAQADNAAAQQMPFAGMSGVSGSDSQPAAMSVCAVAASEPPSGRLSRSMSGTSQLQSSHLGDRKEFDEQIVHAPSASLPLLQRSALFEVQHSRPQKAKRARSDSTHVAVSQTRPSKLSAAAMRSKQDLWQALLRCNGLQWPSASPSALPGTWLTTLSI